MDPEPTAWTGWFRRPKDPWVPLVHAASEDEAWRKLLKAVSESGDLLVRPADLHPDVRRKPR